MQLLIGSDSIFLSAFGEINAAHCSPEVIKQYDECAYYIAVRIATTPQLSWLHDLKEFLNNSHPGLITPPSWISKFPLSRVGIFSLGEFVCEVVGGRRPSPQPRHHPAMQSLSCTKTLMYIYIYIYILLRPYN